MHNKILMVQSSLHECPSRDRLSLEAINIDTLQKLWLEIKHFFALTFLNMFKT